jgi:hypothetical protein
VAVEPHQLDNLQTIEGRDEMRYWLLVFGTLLVMAGIVWTSLWRNLRTEQLTNAELSAQLAARTVSDVAAPSAQSIAVPPPAAMPVCPAAAAVPAAAAAQESSFLSIASISADAAGERELWKDPEYRKAQLTVTRIKEVQNSPGLVEMLGLSDAEANHLFDVLAENQLKFLSVAFGGATAAGPGGSATAFTAEELREAAAGGNVVRVTLGEARYAQYEDYQRYGRAALTQLASLGSTLTSAGQPMSDSQYRALTTALLAEKQSQRREEMVLRTTPNPGAPREAVEMLEANNNRQNEVSRRTLEAAASSLSPAQQQVLRERFEQEAARRLKTIETARSVLKAGMK